MFIALVAGVLLLILANRGGARPLLLREALANPWLPRMAAGMALMLALLLGVPLLRGVMRLALPHATTAIAALAMCCAIFAWLALLRAIARRRVAGSASRPPVA